MGERGGKMVQEKNSLITFELIPQNDYEKNTFIPKLNEKSHNSLVSTGFFILSIAVFFIVLRKAIRRMKEQF